MTGVIRDLAQTTAEDAEKRHAYPRRLIQQAVNPRARVLTRRPVARPLAGRTW